MKKAIKTFIKLICPNRFFLWANGIAVGALLVMTAGIIYMNAALAAAETRAVPVCPQESYDEIIFLPDPTHCRRFYECHNGIPVLRCCPEFLYFCSEKNYCSWTWDPDCRYDCLE